MNSCHFIGYVASDPKSRTSAAGSAWVSFDIAVRRAGKKVDFIHCMAFDKIATVIAKRVKKGGRVSVSGCLWNSSGKTREGITYKTMAIAVREFDFLDPPRDKQDNTQEVADDEIADPEEDFDDAD